MRLKYTSLKSLFFLSIALSSAPAFSESIELNDSQAWQCQSQYTEGYKFSSQSIAFVAPDCPRFFADQHGIFDPLKQSAQFDPANVPQGCFLEGYRRGLGDIATSMHAECQSQLRSSLRAGLQLGVLACRLAPDGAMSPDFDLVRIRSKPFSANSATFILNFVMPVRSKIWANQLSRSQEAGFQIGCLLGERDYFNQVPNGFLLANATPDWKRAAQEVGKEFGRSFCPMETSRMEAIIATLVGDSKNAQEWAHGGFLEGFQSICHKPFTE